MMITNDSLLTCSPENLPMPAEDSISLSELDEMLRTGLSQAKDACGKDLSEAFEEINNSCLNSYCNVK